MATRRISLLVLGVWLGTMLLVALLAADNFNSPARALRSPNGRVLAEVKRIGEPQARAFLRFHAASINRDLFERYGYAEIALGAALFLLLLFATSGNRLILFLSSVMLLLQLVLQFAIIPQMGGLSRGLDLAGAAEMLPERRSFSGYHAAYAVLGSLKLLIGIALAVRLVAGGKRSRLRNDRVRHQLDVVDHPDHRHVDG